MSEPKVFGGQSAISWVRVSTADQARGYSPEGQRRDNRAWAESCGLRIVKEYSLDESASEADNRREWQAMLAYRKAHAIQNIICWDRTRLARNDEDDYVIRKLVNRDGVTLHYSQARDFIDSSASAEKRFHHNISGAASSYESDKIRERTRMGMRTKLEHGEITWEAPIGYKNVVDPADRFEKRRIVVMDEERAPLVKKGFELYGTGQFSLQALTEELNRLGLTSKNGKRRPKGPVSRRCVEKFLKNRFYVGEFWDKKEGIWRHHLYPTFITQQAFDRAQRQLKLANRNIHGRRKDGREFAFKPFLKCKCGYQVTAYEPKPGLRYYVCSQHNVVKNGKRLCSSRPYAEKQIDALVASAVSRLYINERLAAEVCRQLSSASASETADALREQRRLKARITELGHHIEILHTDRRAGVLTVDEYVVFSSKVKAEIAEHERRLAALDVRNAEYQAQGAELVRLLREFPAIYEAQDYAGRAKLLKVIVQRITLRAGEAEVVFQPPFDVLAEAGALLYNENRWGE